MSKVSLFISGPSSSGKTTLIDNFLRHAKECPGCAMYASDPIQEIARTIIARDNLDVRAIVQNNDFDKYLAFQEAICVEHLRQVEEKRRTGTVFISDRGMDPVAFVGQFTPDSLESFKALPSFQMLADDCRLSLNIVLCPLQKEAHDDGTRLLQTREKQLEFNTILTRELGLLEIPFTNLDETSIERRVASLHDIVAAARDRSCVE